MKKVLFAGLLVLAGAVSYTHLDVYKRQVPGRDITRKLLLRSIPVQWCSYIGDSQRRPRTFDEDVYKRQPLL